jgi:hypothetical protein
VPMPAKGASFTTRVARRGTARASTHSRPLLTLHCSSRRCLQVTRQQSGMCYNIFSATDVRNFMHLVSLGVLMRGGAALLGPAAHAPACECPATTQPRPARMLHRSSTCTQHGSTALHPRMIHHHSSVTLTAGGVWLLPAASGPQAQGESHAVTNCTGWQAGWPSRSAGAAAAAAAAV